MAGKLLGNAIEPGTVSVTQLSTTVVTNITTAGGPKVSSIVYPNNATATSNTGNESITLVGTGFESGVQVYVNGSAAPSVSRSNSNSLSFTTPVLSTGTTYPLYVVNTDGGTALVIPGMVVSAGPVWITDSTLTSWAASTALSRTLQATSDSTISYALEAGSTLPAGISLAANGLLSGTLSSPPASETTYNFNVVATDLELQKSTKAFSITTTVAFFNISPEIDGKSSWGVADGAINVTTGNYTITVTSSVTSNVKLWGQGGGFNATYAGGGGGSVTGTVQFTSGQTYYLSIFGAGSSANSSAGGGNAAGIFFGPSAVQANAIVIAGGGGGGGRPDGGGAHPGSTAGGAGGNPAGTSGDSNLAGAQRGGGGGTQSAGGTGGSLSPGPGFATAGSALAGGAGSSNPGYNAIAGGGGGGYYGGGGGGNYAYLSGGSGYGLGGGGGGGSNFASANTSRITNVTHYSGSGSTAGNNSDPNRGGSGTGGGPSTTRGSARIYMSFS